jgi:DNA-binding LytR/AlgR family response regulator
MTSMTGEPAQQMHRSHGANPWVLVVEDELRLREELVTLLGEIAPDIGDVRAASSAEQALLLCRDSMPAIAFLDIKLPGRSGIELALALPSSTRIVFVTAYDEFAIQAFDRGAVDYMLKPISRERLQRCVDRLRQHQTHSAEDLRVILSAIPALQPKAYLRWLTASTGRRTQLIPVQDIIYLQSDNKYTRIVSHDGEHLIEESIKNLLLRLDPAVFVQIHRATVVNLAEVLLVERDETGGTLKLRTSKDVLRISTPYLRGFRAFLG